MQKLTESFSALENKNDVTNKVLMFLLGKEEQPQVAEALKQYYERSVFLSKQWILIGQQHGVIPHSINTDKTAEMFFLLSIGIRVRSSIPHEQTTFNSQEYSSFIINILNHNQ